MSCSHVAIPCIPNVFMCTSTWLLGLHSSPLSVYFLSHCLGNLHLNIVGDSHSTELLNLIEPFVFDWTGKKDMEQCLNGSFDFRLFVQTL